MVYFTFLPSVGVATNCCLSPSTLITLPVVCRAKPAAETPTNTASTTIAKQIFDKRPMTFASSIRIDVMVSNPQDTVRAHGMPQMDEIAESKEMHRERDL